MKTLIVEDSATLCAVYSHYLDGSGLDITSVESLSTARQVLTEQRPQLILLAIELPDGSGLDLIDDLQRVSPRPAVVVITGHGDHHAEEAIDRGADDFLSKPFDAARLRVTLLNAADKLKLSRQVADLSASRDRLGSLCGSSPAMQSVYQTLESLAGTLATAFVMGESGTGKELAARAIHEFSARAPGPFVVVDCSALLSEQLEQALFGTEGGFGLVAQAASGTLFLDEVCSLSFSAQSTLLRLIQHGTYRPVDGTQEVASDVRIIASTNRDPLFEMREGRLREDLYYRIAGVTFCLPPLKERQDLDWLINKFLSSKKYGSEPWQLDSAARTALLRYDWPGNVRQLANVIELAQILGEGSISLMDLPEEIRFYSSENKSSQPMLKDILEELDWNITAVASYLGCDRKTVYRRIKKAGIEIQREIVN